MEKLKIGGIELKSHTVLAPMAGVSDRAYRELCVRFGAAYCVSEMVSSKALSFNSKKSEELMQISDYERPCGIQIFGDNPDCMSDAAKRAIENKADIIDINMGCPVNKVAQRAHAGSALLKDPDLVYTIVKSVVQAVSKPVTVKMRIGWDLEHINAVENAIKIEEAGASAITVHGRTRSQFYTGKADLDWIKRVKQAVSIPVIGNGDVVDIESAKRMLDLEVDAVAIGRGALGNPFIFRELTEYFDKGKIVSKPSNAKILSTIIKHHQYLVQLKGEHLAMLEMRSHVAWYLKGRPGSARIKDQCNKQTDFKEVLNILKCYLI